MRVHLPHCLSARHVGHTWPLLSISWGQIPAGELKTPPHLLCWSNHVLVLYTPISPKHPLSHHSPPSELDSSPIEPPLPEHHESVSSALYHYTRNSSIEQSWPSPSWRNWLYPISISRHASAARRTRCCFAWGMNPLPRSHICPGWSCLRCCLEYNWLWKG